MKVLGLPAGALLLLSVISPACTNSNTKALSEDAPLVREVKTVRVSLEEIETYIESTGSVQVDLEGGTKIVSPLNGVVERIFVKVGDKARRGEPLIMIRSPEVADTYTNYLSALLQARQAERNFRLNQELMSVGAVTKVDLITSETTYEQLKVSLEGLRKKLSIYGIDPDDKEGMHETLTVSAPIDGVVAEILAHKGDRIDSATALMLVADPSKVVVVANIYDVDIERVRLNSEVVFSTDVFPDRTFTGTIKYISDIEDPDTKTVKTYIRVNNAGKVLKQNMFLKIKISGEKRMAEAIPKGALIYKDGEFYAYVKQDKNYLLKKVTPVRETTEKMMAVDGLDDDDEVVISALDVDKS